MDNYNNENSFKVKASIYRKILTYITLLVVVTVGTISYVTIRTESSKLTQNLIHQSEHFARDLEFGAQKAFSSLNWVFVENMLSEFVEEEENGIVFAEIVKPNGEIVDSKNIDEVLKLAPDIFNAIVGAIRQDKSSPEKDAKAKEEAKNSSGEQSST